MSRKWTEDVEALTRDEEVARLVNAAANMADRDYSNIDLQRFLSTIRDEIRTLRSRLEEAEDRAKEERSIRREHARSKRRYRREAGHLRHRLWRWKRRASSLLGKLLEDIQGGRTDSVVDCPCSRVAGRQDEIADLLSEPTDEPEGELPTTIDTGRMRREAD